MERVPPMFSTLRFRDRYGTKGAGSQRHAKHCKYCDVMEFSSLCGIDGMYWNVCLFYFVIP